MIKVPLKEPHPYLSGQLGLSGEDTCDLFDSESPASTQLDWIETFLGAQLAKLGTPNGDGIPILFFYIGHGAFHEAGRASREYCLLIRDTRAPRYSDTSLRVTSLAGLFRTSSPKSSRILFLDCCFAAEAAMAFQGQMEQAVNAKIRQIIDAEPPSGVALLCAASPYDATRLEAKDSLTLFNRELMDVLKRGDPASPNRLSLRQIGDLIWERLRSKELDPSRPEVHTPNQDGGDLADVPLFPNFAHMQRATEQRVRVLAPERPSIAFDEVSGPTGRQGRRARILVAAVTALLAATTAIFLLRPSSGPPSPKLNTTPSITSSIAVFSLSAGAQPINLVSAGGYLWTTEFGRDKISRISVSGQINEYPIQNNARPYGITAGPDGNVWFTEGDPDQSVSGNSIGVITPQGKITEYPLPTNDAGAVGITVGPDKNVWFTENKANKIGQITTAGKITEFALPQSGSDGTRPDRIVAGPDGNLWFTEFASNRIGRMSPKGTLIAEYPTTGAGNPVGVVVHDNELWFAEVQGNRVGRMGIDGVVAGWIDIPTKDTPGSSNLVVDPHDDSVWVTEVKAGKVAHIPNAIPLKVDRELQVAGYDSELLGLALGPDGQVWFSARNSNIVGRIGDSATERTSPGSPTAQIMAVKITSPQAGDTVNHCFSAKGYARNVTNGRVLWLIIRTPDPGNTKGPYWPTEQLTVGSDGSWQTKTWGLGSEGSTDLGRPFWISLYVVDKAIADAGPHQRDDYGLPALPSGYDLISEIQVIRGQDNSTNGHCA